MSPSSSQLPQRSASRTSTPHSRQTSMNTVPKAENASLASKQPPKPLATSSQPQTPPNYTLIIRLPFPRATFVDPTPTSWNSAKDQALWQAISTATGGIKNLDWQRLAEQFDVELEFLLRQAAWLYGRHFEGVKAGMARLGAGSPGVVQGEKVEDGNGLPASTGGVAMEKGGSRESHKASISTVRKVPPLQVADDAKTSLSTAAARSPHPGISRTPSTATVTQSRMFGSGGSRRPSQTYSKAPLASRQPGDMTTGHDGASESDSEDGSTRIRQLPRRSPLTKQPVLGTLSSDGDAEDDEDDDSGGFLPFAAKGEDDDATATLISPPRLTSTNSTDPPPPKGKAKAHPPPQQHPSSSPSASSASSSQPPSTATKATRTSTQAQASALSPRARAAVSGSEGSPSMGSSFSDLDDLSVTKSALEDALLSHVRRGHGGSVIGMGFGSGGGR